jgi:hypothetical protein
MNRLPILPAHSLIAMGGFETRPYETNIFARGRYLGATTSCLYEAG